MALLPSKIAPLSSEGMDVVFVALEENPIPIIDLFGLCSPGSEYTIECSGRISLVRELFLEFFSHQEGLKRASSDRRS